MLLSLVEGGSRVDSGPVSGLSVALVEAVGAVVGRLVPGTAHDVVNVWAPLLSVLLPRVAGTEAELAVANEVLPLVDLLELSCVCAGVDETTDGVSTARGSVRVKLSSVIAPLDVELREVSDTGDLDELVRLEEVGTLDGTVGNETCAVARLETPRDYDSLCVTDSGTWVGGTQETEVLDGVNVDVLALGRLAGVAVSLSAVIVTSLSTLGVSLGWEVVRCVVCCLSQGGEAEEGKESCLLEHDGKDSD